MSSDDLNNANREFKTLQRSFRNWEAGEPSADLWENLEADLAVAAVWDRLDETLEANGSSADKALVESYEDWSPNNSGDGWSRLEEQLSRERVWNRLSVTLSYPVTTSVPWLKMAAASVIFIFTAFYADHLIDTDYPVENHLVSTAAFDGKTENTAGKPMSTGSNENKPVGEQVLAAQSVHHQMTFNLQAQNKRLIVNGTDNSAKNNDMNRASNENGSQVEPVQASRSVNFDPNTTELNANTAESNAVNAADLASLDQLPRKEIPYSGPEGVIEEFSFMPHKAPFRPRFSVLVGGQFAFINEKNRSAFSSSLPSMGIAADAQYHAYVGKVRLTQDIGFSQYAQSNGSYINGRYINLDQKLNTIHLISSVGYTFKGVTVSGGISVNRLLNGYEESRTAITNVYNSKKLQVGATAGVDYHFTPFRNKTALGLGIQYQFVSRMKSQNTVFNDIQGVKLQIKYSF